MVGQLRRLHARVRTSRWSSGEMGTKNKDKKAKDKVSYIVHVAPRPWRCGVDGSPRVTSREGRVVRAKELQF